MSLRSDYEVTITVKKGDLKLTPELLKEHLPLAAEGIPFLEGGGDGDYIILDDDGGSAFIFMRECHPENYPQQFVDLSKAFPDVLFEMEEYIREATEMVEAGREGYLLLNGERCEGTPITHPDGLDDFLDDATHAVHEMWRGRKGRELTPDELYALNDALTAFFDGKSEGN